MDTNEETRPAEPPAPEQPRFHRRTALIVTAAIAALLLAFLMGTAAGRHHDGRDGGDRYEQARGGPFARGAERHAGPGGHSGMPGMRGGARGDGGFAGSGGGPGGGHRGGAMGVVEEAGASSLTIDPLHGGGESIRVTLGDDVEVSARGDDGPHDVEAAEVGDIDAGDIVAVRAERDAGDPGDAADDAEQRTITAAHVMILRDADE